jgi:hypothetical protein
MPGTASVLGVGDAFDPRQNIDGGVRHLRGLIDRYANNYHLALAAYNAGERAVNFYGGIPPYAETQQYVKKILAMTPRAADIGAAYSRTMFRYKDANGVETFTNIPRPPRPSVVRASVRRAPGKARIARSGPTPISSASVPRSPGA